MVNEDQQIMSRVTDLEIKLAYAEDTIETLNQIVIEQQFALQELKKQFVQIQTNLLSQMNDLASDNGQAMQGKDEDDKLRFEIPPHY